MSPNPSSDKKTRELRVLVRLRPYVLAHRKVLLLAGATLPLLAGAQLIGPYLLRVALDDYISPAAAGDDTALAGLWWIVAAFLGVQLVEMALRSAQIYLMQLGGQRIMHDLRRAVFAHVQRLSMSFFDRNPVGRIMTRITSDVETLNELMSQGIVAMARDLVTLVGIVAVMTWIDWRLTLASFIVFPFLVLILSILRSRLRDTYDASRTLVARLASFLQENISGMEVVQAFGQEERCRDDFRQRRDDLLEVDLRGVRYSSFLSAAVQAATMASTALVLAFGGFGILGGTVTIGILVQFMEYLRRFYMPIEELSDRYDTLQRAAAASKKIFTLLDEEPGIENVGRPRPSIAFDSEIKFADVTFGYGDPDTDEGRVPATNPVPVLKGLDLTLRRGEKVALVGSTGAGKSSLIKVLQRLYEWQQGSVTIDGVDIRQFDTSALRRFFGTVPQDVFLFTDTIAENIGLGHDDVDRDAIEAAARIVEADGFIAELPRGYDTLLGERGANLSFGERQLLAFARALAAEPEVLILDEATSSVDSETEASIQRAMRRLVRERTALIIAHRLSTIRDVDRIVVLHHGEIREQGTHQELIEHDGIYATLYRLQYQGQETGGAAAVG